MATVEVTVPDPDMVTIWGYVRDISFKPIPASQVMLKVNPTPQQLNNSFFDRTEITTLTNEEGYFEFQAPGGVVVTLLVHDSNYRITGKLPSSGIVEARSIGVNP